MTKFSTEFKINAVQRYQNEHIGYVPLAKELGVEPTSVQRWVYTANKQGLMALKVHHRKKKYSLDFKLQVVNYYQTHDLGISKVAAQFGINSSQVYSWTSLFSEGGVAALVPKQKGRPTTVKKSKVKRPKITLSEKQEYEEKLMRLEAKLHEVEMERDILKKLPPRSKNLLIDKKPRQ